MQRPGSAFGWWRAIFVAPCVLLAQSAHAFSLGRATPSLSASSNVDLVVIGGGSAGLTAAKFASRFGKSVVLIEKARLGGDCTWTGCVPSKTFIASAKAAHAVATASKFGVGVDNGKPSVDLGVVNERVRRAIQQIYDEDDAAPALTKLGISVVQGAASFQDPSTVRVAGEEGDVTLKAKFGVVISTGARPSVPPIPGLQDGEVPFVTYEDVFDLTTLPNRLTIIGAGAIGCELGQAFQRLGSQVTIIAPGLLPSHESETSDVIGKVFKDEGLTHMGARAVSVARGAGGAGHVVTCSDDARTTVPGDVLLVATGRTPVVEGLNLEQIGVAFSPRGIAVDASLRTNVKGVYAAGDCTGGPQFTHYAGLQGAIAARNALLPLKDPGVLASVPGCVFTAPEVGQVGVSEARAREEHGEDKVAVALRPLSQVDRAVCEDETDGFFKLIYHKKTFKLLGATVVAPAAGEIICELSVAMAAGTTLADLASVVHAYPTLSIAVQQMAAEVYYDKLERSMGLYNALKRLGL